jgi:hypothetical protein
MATSFAPQVCGGAFRDHAGAQSKDSARWAASGDAADHPAFVRDDGGNARRKRDRGLAAVTEISREGDNWFGRPLTGLPAKSVIDSRALIACPPRGACPKSVATVRIRHAPVSALA